MTAADGATPGSRSPGRSSHRPVDAGRCGGTPPPLRLASTRHALPNQWLADVLHVAATTGNDPELDSLLVRIHTETACRRGALALRLRDPDIEQCLVRQQEKCETLLMGVHAPTSPPPPVPATPTRGAAR